MGKVLFCADVDRIQEYVFESARLPEIRGASTLLSELEGDVFRQLDFEPDIIYAAGGRLLAVLPEEKAEGLSREIESLYLRRTKAVTITCAWMPLSEEEKSGYSNFCTYGELGLLRRKLSDDEWRRVADFYRSGEGEISREAYDDKRGFGQMVTLLDAKLRQKKESRPTVPFYEAFPFAERCHSCRTRPAGEIEEIAGEERLLCPICHIKVKKGRKEKSLWIEHFEEHLKEEENLLAGYSVEYELDQVRIPKDLGEIGAACRKPRPGYIGFIYADADSLGEFMAAQRTREDYKLKSKAVRRATEKAVFRAIASRLNPCIVEREEGEKVIIHPFEILTIGGDDVLLIVPGDAALTVALEICQLFAKYAPARSDGSPLSMSAGVVIADEHNPVRFLRDMAKELLESAKSRALQTVSQSGKWEGAVDFHILKSQSMMAGTLKELRGQPPYLISSPDGNGSNEELRLTGRPYTLEEAERLLNTAHDFRKSGFPASQLYALADALPKGRLVSTLFYLYQKARLRDDLRGVLARMEKDWKLRSDRDPAPWVKVDGQGHKTILRDIAELYDFITFAITD